jgi:hypothetical protein
MPSEAVEWAAWRDGVFSVKYRSGAAYDYLDVPEIVYRAFRAATSKGRFINAIVKPSYAFRKRRA